MAASWAFSVRLFSIGQETHAVVKATFATPEVGWTEGDWLNQRCAKDGQVRTAPR